MNKIDFLDRDSHWWKKTYRCCVRQCLLPSYSVKRVANMPGVVVSWKQPSRHQRHVGNKLAAGLSVRSPVSC